jgi:hypothetical protein
MDKIDFWTEILNTWVHDNLNSTSTTKGNILPKHNTYHKIVEYFKGAEYVLRKEKDDIFLDIIHPKYLTPDRIGKGLIKSMDVMLIEDDLEAIIRLNVPLTNEWILQAHKPEGKDNYKFIMLTYEGRRIPNKAA